MLTLLRTYRWPFTISCLFHCILLSLFLGSPSKIESRLSSTHSAQTLQATAVNSTQVQAQIKKIKQIATHKKTLALEQLQQLHHKLQVTHHALLKEQARLIKLKQYDQTLKRRLHPKQPAIRLHDMQLEKQENALQQKILQQQLTKEQNALSEIHATTPAIIRRYKNAILKAIAQQWIVPHDINQNLAAIYRIKLAPNGRVLSATLIHSSGHVALDRSAKIAILKASPLPVPKDWQLFDTFRELRLTVSPKNIVKNSDAIH